MKRRVSLMERAARAVPRLNVLVGLIGVLLGCAILVTCTSMAIPSKKDPQFWKLAGFGFLYAFGGFLVVIVATVFFVGTIYLIVRTSEDVRAVRRRIESSEQTPEPRRDLNSPPS
jgi:hypothetical protein